MDAAVRAGASRQQKTLPEDGRKRLFNLSLDGIGVLLDLESAVVISFISEFEKISGHGLRGLMTVGHGSEPCGIYGVREKIDQYGELVVGYEGVGGCEELEFGGVGGEDFAEGADLVCGEAFDFEG